MPLGSKTENRWKEKGKYCLLNKTHGINLFIKVALCAYERKHLITQFVRIARRFVPNRNSSNGRNFVFVSVFLWENLATEFVERNMQEKRGCHSTKREVRPEFTKAICAKNTEMDTEKGKLINDSLNVPQLHFL